MQRAVSAAYHDCLKIIWCRIASGHDTFPERFAISALWWCRVHTKFSLLVIQHALSSSHKDPSLLQQPLPLQYVKPATHASTLDVGVQKRIYAAFERCTAKPN